MRVHLERILCTTDFSDFSNHAVPYGIALARDFRAKLYLCHVIDLSSAAIYGEAVLALDEQQKRMTQYAQEQISALMGAHSIDSEPLITTGHPAHEISRLAQEKGVDLTIAASHGRSGLKRLILGSVTERLMRTLPCPLLIVRSPERGFITPADQEIKLRRILVGCDFSPDSSLAFQYGLSFAQEFQSDLHLVHVIQPPVYENLVKPTSARTEEFQQDLRDELHERLTSLVPEEAHSWCTPITTLLAGQPDEELTKYAVVNDIDLIVLGVRGQSLVETLLVGSTTDRVIRRAPCPVLSVLPAIQSK
ncbi:MAG: universal stress protein [Desulfobacteraceae bacterium]|jgi:nucleotide-binding universal stress UspA family protein